MYIFSLKKIKMSVKILFILMSVQYCFMLDLSSQRHGTDKHGLLDSFRKHVSKKDAGQDFTINEKKSLASSGNHLTTKSDDDTVSQEEFDEAIATLTAMYDMLSMQMMGVVGDVDAVTTAVAELQSHTVKRCETGMRNLYCEYDCCYLDFGSECIQRLIWTDMFPVHTTFSQAFDVAPVVMVSVSINFQTMMAVDFAVVNGFFHTPAKDITTTQFTVELRFSMINFSYFNDNYVFTWIACQH